MKVISKISKIRPLVHRPILVIGVFDGLHIGHQRLIRRAIKSARAHRTKTVVMTFHPHPVHVLSPEVGLPLISALHHRLKLLEGLGVDVTVVIPFTRKFSSLSPKNFIKRYIVKYIAPEEIYVGDDFRFGSDRAGDIAFFANQGERYGFKVNYLQSVKNDAVKISSSTIRNLIMEGNFGHVRKLLGRDFSIMGVVIKGKGRGRTLGFPTANVNTQEQILPPMGVYAVKVFMGKKMYLGMANVGRRPSFEKKNNRINLEVHLFDYHRKMYGREVIVGFIKKIREEKMFNTKEKLIERLEIDQRIARSILR